MLMDGCLTKEKKSLLTFTKPQEGEKSHTRSPGSVLHYNRARYVGLGRQCITKPKDSETHTAVQMEREKGVRGGEGGRTALGKF